MFVCGKRTSTRWVIADPALAPAPLGEGEKVLDDLLLIEWISVSSRSRIRSFLLVDSSMDWGINFFGK